MYPEKYMYYSKIALFDNAIVQKVGLAECEIFAIRTEIFTVPFTTYANKSFMKSRC